MAAPRPIELIIVGAGNIGSRHAASVNASPGARLIAVVDPSPSADAVAANFCVQWFPSIEQCLDTIRLPDAAIICTPNSAHVSIAMRLLQHGISVLVEKPISSTAADGAELIDTARVCGKQLLVGHHRRFNPYVTAAKAVLSSGQIGRPIAVSGLWALYKPPEYFQSPWDWRAEAAGGGVVAINLCHEIDTLHYLLGPICRVHAEQTISKRGHAVEEGAAILLRFASGVVGTFILSDACPSPHNFESATGENPVIPKAGKDVYRIFGSEGVLSVGDMVVTTFREGIEKSWSSQLADRSIAVGSEVPFDEQIEHLVRVLRGEEIPRCSGPDGLSAVAVCDAVKQAIATGQAIDIQRMHQFSCEYHTMLGPTSNE